MRSTPGEQDACLSEIKKQRQAWRAYYQEVRLIKKNVLGDPDREAKVWLDKLAEVDRERRGYLRLAAKGRMTDEGLDEALGELEEARKAAQGEIEALKHRRERIEQLEQDKEALLDYYEGIAPGALDSLTPEERHRFYKVVRLQVSVRPGRGLEISWAGGEGFSVCETGTASPSTSMGTWTTPMRRFTISGAGC